LLDDEQGSGRGYHRARRNWRVSAAAIERAGSRLRSGGGAAGHDHLNRESAQTIAILPAKAAIDHRPSIAA